MFKVKSIETNNIYTVYGCQEIRGIIYFLIHNGTHWVWTEAERFNPYEELTQPSYIPIYVPSQPYQPYDPITHPSITWTTNAEPTE